MKNQSLYVQLADEIFDYINRERINSGERLPSERKLAEQFSTSRATVREAVRILENKGIIDVRVGKGMYLKEKQDTDFYRIDLWKADYMELLEVKILLDDSIIRKLCEYFPMENLPGLEDALEKMERGYENWIFDLEADSSFHRRLRACCDNKTLAQLADNLMIKLEEYAPQIDFNTRPFLDTIPHHRIILNAILNHDYLKARESFYTIYELDKYFFK